MPTRLINVRLAITTGNLQLFVRGSSPPAFTVDDHFITLSHCWGAWGAKEMPVLKSSNLDERIRVGISIATVPKTFRDALIIVDWFNVEWLWIDSLCIIQDSKADWLHEASMMSSNYQNALLNISADTFEESRAGCFSARQPLDVQTLKIGAKEAQRSWWLVPDVAHQSRWMDNAPSFSRAWIHRERQLSPRILRFTEKEIVWECCGKDGTGFASETFPGGAPFANTFNRDNKFQVAGLRQKKGTDSPYRIWGDVVEHLSSKLLTKPTDMPIVLSSLAEEFRALLPRSDHYLAGLWKSQLPRNLLWDTVRYAEPSNEYIAPSWSWMAPSTSVKLGHRYVSSTQRCYTLTSVQDSSVSLMYPAQPFGPLVHGTLTLLGFLRLVHISFVEDSNNYDLSVYDQTSASPARFIGHSWHDYEGQRCDLQLDLAPKTQAFDCYCLFVTLVNWDTTPTHRKIECLIVEQAEDAPGCFRRLGTMDLYDEFALKMRYALGKGEWSHDEWMMLRSELQKKQVEDEVEGRRMRGTRRQKPDDGLAQEEDGGEEAAAEEAVDKNEADLLDDLTTDGRSHDSAPSPESLYRFDDIGAPHLDMASLRRLVPQLVTLI